MGMLRMLPERAAVSLISAFPSWTATWEPQLKRSRKPAANYWSEANTHPALLTLMLPIRTDTSSSWVLIEAPTRHNAGRSNGDLTVRKTEQPEGSRFWEELRTVERRRA